MKNVQIFRIMNANISVLWEASPIKKKQIFKDIYDSKEYSDITIICDDNFKFKAHRFILSECSPVLKEKIDIMFSDQNQNTCIDLQGVHHADLEQILRFLYLGEVSCEEGNIGNFFKLGKYLKIESIVEFFDDKSFSSKRQLRVIKEDKKLIKGMKKEKDTRLENKIMATCKICNLTLTKLSLNRHYQSLHENIKNYHCDKCEYKAFRKTTLENHKKAIHNHLGFKFSCFQCDYKNLKLGNLKIHLQSKHQGKRLQCQICDSQFTTVGNLNLHMKRIHEREEPCDICDYQGRYLRRHKKSKHSSV